MSGILLTEEVDVTIIASNVKYYENLGYKIPMRKSTDIIYKKAGVFFNYGNLRRIYKKTLEESEAC